jgi:hypothetical protein
MAKISSAAELAVELGAWLGCAAWAAWAACAAWASCLAVITAEVVVM